jgi:hypothetical protein
MGKAKSVDGRTFEIYATRKCVRGQAVLRQRDRPRRLDEPRVMAEHRDGVVSIHTFS